MSSNTYTRLLWRGDGYSQLPQGQRIGVSCYKEHKFLQALLQLYQSRGIALEQGEPPDLEAEVKQLARCLNLALGRCWKLSHELRWALRTARSAPSARSSAPSASGSASPASGSVSPARSFAAEPTFHIFDYAHSQGALASQLEQALMQHGFSPSPPDRRCQLLVPLGSQVLPPRLNSYFLQQNFNFLPVLAREGGWLIGPLTVPGLSQCSTCLDLYLSEADPAWPTLATQLLCQPVAASSQSVAAHCINIVAQVVASFFSGSDHWLGRYLEFSQADLVGFSQVLSPHPECGCGGLQLLEPIRPVTAEALAAPKTLEATETLETAKTLEAPGAVAA
jgi:UBA/THIF-type NAD/FAD binding protein